MSVTTAVSILCNLTNDSEVQSDDEYYDVMTDDMRVSDVIRHVILPIICACGILGIILTIIVLSHKNMSTSTNCYLMALAIADLIFLVLLIPRLVETHLRVHTPAYYTYQIVTTYSIKIGNICLLASIWITVMLAVERYIAICRPFLAAKLCTVPRARVLILLIYSAAVLVRMVNFWQHRVNSAFHITSNSTIHYIQPSEFAYHHFWFVYAWLVDVFMASILPFSLLLIMNTLLIRAVKRSTRYIQRNQLATRRRSSSTVQREELQVSTMLISVIIVFFVCQAPYVVYIALTTTGLVHLTTTGFFLFRDVTMLLLTLKSAVNFILYCWFSERFRVTLRHTVCVKQCLDAVNKNTQSSEYFSLHRMSISQTHQAAL